MPDTPGHWEPIAQIIKYLYRPIGKCKAFIIIKTKDVIVKNRDDYYTYTPDTKRKFYSEAVSIYCLFRKEPNVMFEFWKDERGLTVTP